MPNFYDNFLDRLNEREMDLVRYDAFVRKGVLKELRALEKELEEKIAEIDPGRPRAKKHKDKRVKKLLAETRGIIQGYYKDLSILSIHEMQDLAVAESAWLLSATNAAATTQLLNASLTRGLLRSIGSSVLLRGQIQADWWRGDGEKYATEFAQAIRMGMLAGESVPEMIARVREFYPGRRSAAAALVRTSVQSVSAETRRQTYFANQDVVYAIQQVSTLDGRTTKTCLAYDLATWAIPGMEPIDGNELAYVGGVPRHWNCRSSEVPKVKGSKMPDSVRVSRTEAGNIERISDKTAAPAWFKNKSEEFQNAQVGTGVAKLWRDGKITFQQMINEQTGRPLSLAEIQKKHGL
jgi:hypothetical protein